MTGFSPDQSMGKSNNRGSEEHGNLKYIPHIKKCGVSSTVEPAIVNPKSGIYIKPPLQQLTAAVCNCRGNKEEGTGEL